MPPGRGPPNNALSKIQRMQTHHANQQMKSIAELTAHDSAAMKQLSFIALILLPVTVVSVSNKTPNESKVLGWTAETTAWADRMSTTRLRELDRPEYRHCKVSGPSKRKRKRFCRRGGSSRRARPVVQLLGRGVRDMGHREPGHDGRHPCHRQAAGWEAGCEQEDQIAAPAAIDALESWRRGSHGRGADDHATRAKPGCAIDPHGAGGGQDGITVSRNSGSGCGRSRPSRGLPNADVDGTVAQGGLGDPVAVADEQDKRDDVDDCGGGGGDWFTPLNRKRPKEAPLSERLMVVGRETG